MTGAASCNAAFPFPLQQQQRIRCKLRTSRASHSPVNYKSTNCTKYWDNKSIAVLSHSGVVFNDLVRPLDFACRPLPCLALLHNVA